MRVFVRERVHAARWNGERFGRAAVADDREGDGAER